MNYRFGTKSLKRIEGVDDEIVECAKRALARSRYDMTIPWMGGLRTAEEQRDIFDEGHSKCDGYEVKSHHQSGLAIDVIPYVTDGRDPYSMTREMNHFARLMLEEWQSMLMECNASGIMVWGGTFGRTGWDKPHFEIHR